MFVILCITFNITYNALVMKQSKDDKTNDGRTRLAFAIMNTLLMFCLIGWFIYKDSANIAKNARSIFTNVVDTNVPSNDVSGKLFMDLIR